jgi:hypothetical protein
LARVVDSPPAMRLLECVICLVMVWTATSIAVVECCGCIDLPMTTAPPPRIEVIASWDVRQCRAPQRIAVELVNDAGARVSRAAPCASGAMTLDVPELGAYRGRVYAWQLGSAAGSAAGDAVELDVDASVTRWDIARVP